MVKLNSIKFGREAGDIYVIKKIGDNLWYFRSEIDSIQIDNIGGIWKEIGTTAEYLGNVDMGYGTGISDPFVTVKIKKGKLVLDDGKINDSVYVAIKVRNHDFLRVFGNSTNGSFSFGSYNLLNYKGPTGQEALQIGTSITGSRNANYVYRLTNSALYGFGNLAGSSTHFINSEPNGSIHAFGYYNFRFITDSYPAGDTLGFSAICAVGDQNGASIPAGSSNIYLFGRNLLDIGDDAFTDYSKPINNLMGFGFGQVGHSMVKEGTFWLSAMTDSTSFVNFNVDEIRKNGIPFSGGGGDFVSTDTTNYLVGKAVIINGTEPHSTEIMRVNGDVYIEGSVYGPYINNPGTDNIFFGESIEVTDSTANIIQMVAGETIAIGDLLYTDTDWKVYISDNAIDSAARVQYIAYTEGDDEDLISVVIPGSFVKNTGWNLNTGYIYLDNAGGITQTPTTISSEWVTEIGWATSDTTMFFLPTVAIKLD
jgi:hypothetical protein